ncbi:MAG: hypothetical protein HY869_18890 [Chloroflexi bacterium]|nr:hypothetical protein [Chloroflexota bacterium]
MNDKRMKDALESIARRGVPENTNLWPELAAKLERKSPMTTLRSRPLLAMLIALVVVLALSGVAYALGRALGYIPGVGMVNQSLPIRILSEPIIAERDGLTVTVSTLVADSEHTFVAYRIDGIIVPEMPPLTCDDAMLPSLRLPDGSRLDVLTGGYSGGVGGEVGTVLKLDQSVTYAAIPADVNTVTLTFACILPEGSGPKNWQITLGLSPAPKDYATPGVEIGATFVSSYPSIPTKPTPTWDPQSTPNPAMPTFAPRSGLYLEKVIELPRSYVLIGNFTDAQELPGPVEFNLDPNADLPHIEDGLGNSVDFKVREDLQPEMGWGARYWAFEIAKPIHGPLTITLDQVNIAVTDTTRFTFDAGLNPQVGQKWEIDLPIHLRGYEYVIDSVEAIEGGYLFKYHSGSDAPEGVGLIINILGVSLDQQNNMQVNGMLINQRITVVYADSIVYPPPLPTGMLTVELSLTESVALHGPWSLTWSPPENP